MVNSTANVLKGKIKRITHNPPYMLATIELDPNATQEITVSYLPVGGTAKEPVTGTEPQAAADPAAAAPLTQGDGVTVLVPVPNAVIMRGF
ncbi:MAG TPA: hypothetical protein VGV37_08310 [Aliidongia sp.]|uniref:hypothetical protein n=1 Tax=Aliidongia sp. TaxID=1914230 RepID=UPI002DDCE44D|nr:hypothetical protein [Aliidongia sp.]HEV2674529.1 hypothetical protein [Aliidongia sp.]